MGTNNLLLIIITVLTESNESVHMIDLSKFIGVTLQLFFRIDLTITLLYYLTGRAVRIQVPQGRISNLLILSLIAAADWVYYENDDYVRISVIPDSKFEISF